MRVLTVFAHPGPRSFCHAVLDRFDAGLRDAGHTNEILDLYAIGFDPILRARDSPSVCPGSPVLNGDVRAGKEIRPAAT